MAQVYLPELYSRYMRWVVVADSRSPRDGKFIAEIGTYDPNQEPAMFKVNEEEVKKWISNGAKPTETVARLFKKSGILE